MIHLFSNLTLFDPQRNLPLNLPLKFLKNLCSISNGMLGRVSKFM